MKKVLLAIVLCAALPISARPLKQRMSHLEEQLKAHAESENNSWELLKNIDQRLYRMENRLSACPSPDMFDQEQKSTPRAHARKRRSANVRTRKTPMKFNAQAQRPAKAHPLSKKYSAQPRKRKCACC